jgi:HEAT repeat protein
MRSAPLALAICLATSLGGAAAALDTVTLKDGQVLEGTVEDRGTYILVHRSLGDQGDGSIRIERHEILRIEIDEETPRVRRAGDLVVLLNGDEVEGRVELRNDGRHVVVMRERGELALDRRNVSRIVWAEASAPGEDEGEASRPAPAPVSALLDRLLADVASDDEILRRQARDRLLDVAGLMLPYLAARGADESAPDVVRGVIDEVVRAARVEAVMGAELRARLPELPRRMVDPDPDVRLQALKDAVVATTRQAAPVLLHVAQRDPAARVRAFCLGQLSLIGDTDSLMALLDSDDGNMRFAAAVALGDNGVYAGVPLLIEGLRHEAPEVRRLAIEKLEAWTGQFLGYFAEEPVEKREAAVVRWERWFDEQGAAFVQASLRATIHRDRVSQEDKDTGRALWIAAQNLWDQARNEPMQPAERTQKLQRVRYQLERALGRYPQFTNARLALAELLYTELGEPETARRELELVRDRYSEEGGDMTRYLALLHLARVARVTGDAIEAEKQLRLARNANPAGVEASEELGRLFSEQALRPEPEAEDLDAEARRALLARAAEAYTDALARMAVQLKELGTAEDTADADLDRAAPFERGRALGRLADLQEQARRKTAELFFERARCYAALRDDTQAATDYAAAAQLAPDVEAYRRAAEIWGTGAAEEAPSPAPTPPEDDN